MKRDRLLSNVLLMIWVFMVKFESDDEVMYLNYRAEKFNQCKYTMGEIYD
ncbi:hypothetical protein BJ095_1515 [Ureibacillus chungkukjangi]|uniref:Uncharacterized protein n=1 Tax=Ureibacillus chungkukjangi TaxID=1202712 RepID=A0A318TBP5_9BACL|nr:hypothetical protein BJ095_1515 [Ureibacillus chungkukjangi]